jgi:hypothetical protein
MCRLPPVIKMSSSGRAIRKSSSNVITVKPRRSRRGQLQASTCLEVDLSFFSVPMFKHFANLSQYDLIEIGVTS